MRLSLAILALIILCGCPQAQESEAPATVSSQAAAGQSADLPEHRVALVFSETESDPWVNEIVNTLGAELGLDLWSKPGAGEYFDLFGPYEVERDTYRLVLDICLCGFSGVGDLAGQEVIGGEALAWLEGLDIELAWLDGDPVQFQIGRYLSPEIPVVFSGVVIERRLYYDYERPVTGVYQRFSLPVVMGRIWTQAPDATTYALIVDDSPVSAGRAQRFVSFHGAMPEGHEFIVPVAASSWTELEDIVANYAEEADAFIFCGVGEEGSSTDFTDNRCPADLVVGLGKPAIVLGPSAMDHCGAISLRLKPSVHCLTAYALVEQVLAGADPLLIPSITPDDIGVFVSEVEVEQ